MKHLFTIFIFFLLISCGLDTSSKAAPKVQTFSQIKATVTDNNVRMRSLPAIDSSIITLLDKGDVVSVIGISNEKVSIPSYSPDYWYNVKKNDDKEGWVFGGLLTVDEGEIPAISKNEPKVDKNQKVDNDSSVKKDFSWKELINEEVLNIAKNSKYLILATKNNVVVLDKLDGKTKWWDKTANLTYIYSNDDIYIYLNYASKELNILDLKKTDKEFKNVKREKIALDIDNSRELLPYFGFKDSTIYFFQNIDSQYNLVTMTLKGTFEYKLKIDYKISDIKFDLDNGSIFILSKDKNIYMYSI